MPRKRILTFPSHWTAFHHLCYPRICERMVSHRSSQDLWGTEYLRLIVIVSFDLPRLGLEKLRHLLLLEIAGRHGRNVLLSHTRGSTHCHFLKNEFGLLAIAGLGNAIVLASDLDSKIDATLRQCQYTRSKKGPDFPNRHANVRQHREFRPRSSGSTA